MKIRNLPGNAPLPDITPKDLISQKKKMLSHTQSKKEEMLVSKLVPAGWTTGQQVSIMQCPCAYPSSKDFRVNLAMQQGISVRTASPRRRECHPDRTISPHPKLSRACLLCLTCAPVHQTPEVCYFHLSVRTQPRNPTQQKIVLYAIILVGLWGSQCFSDLCQRQVFTCPIQKRVCAVSYFCMTLWDICPIWEGHMFVQHQPHCFSFHKMSFYTMFIHKMSIDQTYE